MLVNWKHFETTSCTPCNSSPGTSSSSDTSCALIFAGSLNVIFVFNFLKCPRSIAGLTWMKTKRWWWWWSSSWLILLLYSQQICVVCLHLIKLNDNVFKCPFKAALCWLPLQVILTNLSSVNPTSVNGEVLQQSERLKHGDVITIIDRSFRWATLSPFFNILA